MEEEIGDTSQFAYNLDIDTWRERTLYLDGNRRTLTIGTKTNHYQIRLVRFHAKAYRLDNDDDDDDTLKTKTKPNSHYFKIKTPFK